MHFTSTAIAVVAASLAIVQAAPSTTTTSELRVCATDKIGSDFIDNDMGNAKPANGLWEGCQRLCIERTGCIGFSFREGVCYFKKDRLITEGPVANVTSGIVYLWPSGPCKRTFIYSKGFDFPKEDISQFLEFNSEQGCAESCRDNGFCGAFTWFENKCALKKGRDTAVRKDGAWSGIIHKTHEKKV